MLPLAALWTSRTIESPQTLQYSNIVTYSLLIRSVSAQCPDRPHHTS
jgi:hypothetical protein